MRDFKILRSLRNSATIIIFSLFDLYFCIFLLKWYKFLNLKCIKKIFSLFIIKLQLKLCWSLKKENILVLFIGVEKCPFKWIELFGSKKCFIQAPQSSKVDLNKLYLNVSNPKYAEISSNLSILAHSILGIIITE